jgi:hypothetical protein
MAWSKIYYDTKRQDQATTTSDDQGNVTQQLLRTFIVVDDATGAQPAILAAASASIMSGNFVPLPGSLYTVDGQAGFKCTQSTPRRSTESPYVFEVQVQFTRKFVFQPPDTSKWNIDISIKGQKVTQTMYQSKDSDGNPIDVVNSAKQPFDPSIPETHYDEIIEISYNTTSADSGTFAGLRGKVNDSGVSFDIKGMSRTYDARQLLCDEISMSTTLKLDDDSTPVWKVQITLIGRDDTFVEHVLDQGYYEIDPDDATKIKQLMDTDGQLLSAPARLDGMGAKLDADADPEYLDFYSPDEADLSGLFDGLS